MKTLNNLREKYAIYKILRQVRQIQRKYKDSILSQYAQDIFVKLYYATKSPKVKYHFIDIGANDGISLSNTYALENPSYNSLYQSLPEQNWGGAFNRG